MTADKFNRYWVLITVFLGVLIVIGGIVVWLKYSPSQPIEISIPTKQELVGMIYIGGAVNNPGGYPFTAKDSIEALIQAAGGNTTGADLSRLKLYIPQSGEAREKQKIDINRAEVWLLKALPGIGDTLAQRIVDYRQLNGLFHNTGELLKVAGIGTTIYEQIEDLITVAD
ncbi:MAG: ComEA family DNA-binding protein [Chloroflexota bacterium]